VSRPLFTVCIPTIGRPTLPRTLESIPAGVEVIVVADTHEMDVGTFANVQAYTRGRCLAFDAGRHDMGSPQIDWAFRKHASGRWLLNCGDDDVYEPRAFTLMEQAISEQQGPAYPLMFKVELLPNTMRGGVASTFLWSDRRIERFVVTGQSFACPNDPERFGDWENDWRFMQTTVANYGGAVDWRDELIARCY